MAAPERVRLLATARKQARDMLLHSHARIKPTHLGSACPHLEARAITP
jgi:hypothetical protein